MVGSYCAGDVVDQQTDCAENRVVETTALHHLQELERLVDALAASWMEGPAAWLNRRLHRVVFERDVAITPLRDTDLSPLDEPYRVRTCDISRGGLSFEHVEPLPYRTVAATFLCENDSPESIVIRLKWCRFTRARVYRSGGQFLRINRFQWPHDLDLSALRAG